MANHISITFLGDVACPKGLMPKIIRFSNTKYGMSVVNLEGAIVPASADLTKPRVKKPVSLYNSEEVICHLKQWNTRVVSLANNHMFDFLASPRYTVDCLRRAGINACGAGQMLAEAAKPAMVELDGQEVLFLAFGWEPIQCLLAKESMPGVNPLLPLHVLESVKRTRCCYPKALVVLLMHWGYELELYPLPMHRQLAFAAIEAGADAVIGHHPHCVQGIELYKGAPVVYSLGNWFLPEGEWFGRTLTYPAFTRRQLAFEWYPRDRKYLCHWYTYNPVDHTVNLITVEELEISDVAADITPFSGMTHDEYCKWFKENRSKRKGLPVYEDYQDTAGNWWRDRWVGLRQRIIEASIACRITR